MIDVWALNDVGARYDRQWIACHGLLSYGGEGRRGEGRGGVEFAKLASGVKDGLAWVKGLRRRGWWW